MNFISKTKVRNGLETAAIHKQFVSEISIIKEVIRSNRLVSDRVEKLTALGFNVQQRAMGSGGVLHVKKAGKEARIQIGYGHSRHNYAMCVILDL